MNVGIFGWCTHTGLGYVNRDLWSTGRFARWVIVSHPKLGVARDMLDPIADRVTDRVLSIPFGGDIPREALDGLDAVVVAEQTYRASQDLFDVCRARGIATILVPMIEWLPAPDSPQWRKWGAKPDAIFAPTKYSADACASDARRAAFKPRWLNRIVGGSWGIDLAGAARVRRVRETAETFLFCNGWGGVDGRKGLASLIAAAKKAPEVPIVVRSQGEIKEPLPPNMTLLVDDVTDRWSLYARGDVLLCPSRFEGLGLQLYEAQACGLPVLTTNAEPMRSAGPVKVIDCEQHVTQINGRNVPAWNCKAAHFALMLRTLHRKSIAAGSAAAMAYISDRHDIRNVADSLLSLAAGIDVPAVT